MSKFKLLQKKTPWWKKWFTKDDCGSGCKPKKPWWKKWLKKEEGGDCFPKPLKDDCKDGNCKK